MYLSDMDILSAVHSGQLGISPMPPPGHIQPASIDLTLDSTYRVLTADRPWMDPAKDSTAMFALHTARPGEPLVLPAGCCALASTREAVRLPPNMVGVLHGKSSIGRLFVVVHTAGFVDPGFNGNLTLELVNHAPRPVRLWPGMRIVQLALSYLTQPAAAPYGEWAGSRYQNQPAGPIPSKSWQRFTSDTHPRPETANA